VVVQVVEIGRVGVSVPGGLVAVRVAVLGLHRRTGQRVVRVLVVPVVVAVGVLVLDRRVLVGVSVTLGEMEGHANRQEHAAGDAGRAAERLPRDAPGLAGLVKVVCADDAG